MASTVLDGEDMTDLVREANQARVKVSVLPSLVDALGPRRRSMTWRASPSSG